MTRHYSLSLFLAFILLFAFTATSQNCGIKNPSFENFTNCPSGFSQYEKVEGWINIFPDALSEPDYFNESCPNGQFGNFNYTGYSDVDGTVFSDNSQHLCGRIGMYLNKHTGDDTRLKEYISQRVDLDSGVVYQIKVQLAKSSATNSSTIQRDLTFFGYNGAFPAAAVGFCPVGTDSLGAISGDSISTVSTEFTINFTPTQDYDYLVLGANCNGLLYATATGYIFMDRIEMTSLSDSSAFTPIIEKFTNDTSITLKTKYNDTNSTDCKNCFSDYRNTLRLEGNQIPSGIIATWSQNQNNPEAVVFTDSNKNKTGLTGSTFLSNGFYTFYYSFTNGICTMTDSIEIEVRTPQLFSAGPDVLNCGGNNDNPGSTDSIIRFRSSAGNATAMNESTNTVEFLAATIPANYTSFYWSMINPDGTEHIFPATQADSLVLDSGNCQGRVIKEYNYLDISPDYYLDNVTPTFSFSIPQDSVYFILTVIDECKTTLKDTMLYVVNDVNLRFDQPGYCPNETVLINQVPMLDSCFTDRALLKNRANLTFTWSIDDTALIPVNLNVSDSLQLVIMPNARRGAHLVRLTVFDSVTNCSFFDEHVFHIVDSTGSIDAGDDILFCGGNNDISYDSSYSNTFAKFRTLRSVEMDAFPPLDSNITYDNTTWWSMIREDGTEWTFPNPCGIPFDGNDEGDVTTFYYTSNPSDCGDIDITTDERYWSHSPNARFHIRNARDTIEFIFHILGSCGNDSLYKDTVIVYMNDVDLNRGQTFFCITDTGMMTQFNHSNYRKLRKDSNLIYSWSGPSDVYFLDSTVADSVLFHFDPATPRNQKILKLTVTDTTSGCTWYDETRINLREDLDSINAGDDIILCNSNFVNQSIKMNAFPSFTSTNRNSYTTYWGVMQPNGTEYIFANSCGIPHTGTGMDEGLIYTNEVDTNIRRCGRILSTQRDYANSPEAEFFFKRYGERKMVFHTIEYCDTSIHLTDTIIVKWDFREPFINAGPDQSPNCDGAILSGSPSASSSGTSGCFKWKQISGPGTLDLVDSTKRVAELINLDLAPSGVYQFEYTLGCLFCPRKDTLSITIDSIYAAPFKLTWDTTVKICVTDSMQFVGRGGREYAWYINDSLIQPFSLDSIFSVAITLDSVKVSVEIKDSVNECISFNQNLSHTFVGRICYADRDTIYTCGDACVSTKDLPYGNHVFTSTGTNITPIGATFSLSDTCITYNQLLGPSTWLYDTLSVVLIDTIDGIFDTTDVFIINCDSSIYLSCKNDTVYLNSQSIANIDTSHVIDSLFASTGIDSVYLSRNNFNCNDLGQNIITVTARNIYHNQTQSCAATVTVIDTIKPLVICNDTTLYLGNSGQVFFDTSSVLSTVIENCTVDSVWLDKNSAICNQDTVVVTVFARDQSGNIGQCKSIIYIKDTVAPVVFCHDTTLYLNASGKVFFDTSAVLNSIYENCTIDSVWINKDSAICQDNTVSATIFARDNSGNIGQCDAQLIILDTIKPIVFCHDTNLFLDANGKVYFNINTIYSSVIEACLVDSIWINKDSADCSVDSVNITIYAKDNSGSIGQCQATAYITDNTRPVAICKPSIVFIAPNGVVGIDSSYLDNGSYDNCEIITITLSRDSFDCTHVGPNMITMIVTDKNGLQDSCSALVTVLDTNTYRAIAGKDTSYCNVTSIVLNGNTPYASFQGTWALSPSVSSANTPTIANITSNNTAVTGLTEGEYSFVWNMSNKACYDLYDTVTIKIFDQPTASLSSDIDICYENSQNIMAQPLVGLASGSWTNYYNSANTPSANYQANTATIGNLQQGGDYSFYFEATNGVCPASRDSITISKHYTPKPNFILDTNAICEGGCINFINTSTIPTSESIANYEWKIDSFSTYASDFTLCFDEKGQKSVSLVTTSNWGCKDSTSASSLITVHENPIADFDFEVNKNAETFYQFTDKSVLAVSYLYDFGDGNSSTLKNPTHNFETIQDFTIKQVVTSAMGCKDSTTQEIEVRDLKIFIPNSFTPNNDGLNDIFLPASEGFDTKKYDLQIYNRWGELIFSTVSSTNGWDGTYQGQPVQLGSYVWKLRIKKLDSSLVKELQGQINVIR
ncbi:MAG: gliding motility-associated C-terminal domain-containing protein [Flavobacteriales bacterium]